VQVAALDEFAKLSGDLLKRRDVQVGIDGEDDAAHDVRGTRETRRA